MKFYFFNFNFFYFISGHSNAPILHLGTWHLDVQLSIGVIWLNLPDQCGGDQCRALHLYSSWHLQVLLPHRYHMVPLWWSGLCFSTFFNQGFSESVIVNVCLVELFTIMWKMSGQVPFPSFHCKRKRKLSELKLSHRLLFFRKFHFYVVTKL